MTPAKREQLLTMGQCVEETAYHIYCRLGIERDYCVQYSGLQSTVFGCVNRLIWSPIRGFRLDEKESREEIRNKFKELMGDLSG